MSRMSPQRRFGAAPLALALCAALLVSACAGGGGQKTQRYSRSQAQESLEAIERPGLVLGDFALAPDGVLDGDTISVMGLDASLRVLAIDTEETYKSGSARRDAEDDFEAYRQKELADSPLDKFGTPMGEEAKRWTEEFFQGVDTVRLERDHPKEVRGHYNRYLVYIFKRGEDGEWKNFNVESVRAGMSPYFTKYGYSRRFHDEFVEAQKEARAAQRGIWDPEARAYGLENYEQRLAIWNARADFIRDFEERAKTRDDHIVLTHWDARERLEDRKGEEVSLLGLVGDIERGDGDQPTRVELSRRQFDTFPIIFFDDDVYASSGVEEHEGHFVEVRGEVNEYTYSSGQSVLQIIVNEPSQISGSEAPFIDATALGDAR